MTKANTAYTEVGSVLIDELVRRIRAAGNPEKINLFGSRARGEGRPDSDLDILPEVVHSQTLPPRSYRPQGFASKLPAGLSCPQAGHRMSMPTPPRARRSPGRSGPRVW